MVIFLRYFKSFSLKYFSHHEDCFLVLMPGFSTLSALADFQDCFRKAERGQMAQEYTEVGMNQR